MRAGFLNMVLLYVVSIGVSIDERNWMAKVSKQRLSFIY